MSITVVQSGHAESAAGGTTIGVTLAGVTVGNAIVALQTMSDNVTLSSIKDQTPTSFAIDENRDCTNEGQWLTIASLLNSPAGSRTITATYSASATSNRGIQAFECSGMPTSGSALTGTPTGNDSGAGTATAFDSSISTTPGVSGAIVFAYGEGNSHQPAAAGAFTQDIQDTVNLLTSEHLIQGAPAAVSPSFTLSVADKWCVVIAAYAPASVAAQILVPPPSMNDVRLWM